MPKALKVFLVIIGVPVIVFVAMILIAWLIHVYTAGPVWLEWTLAIVGICLALAVVLYFAIALCLYYGVKVVLKYAALTGGAIVGGIIGLYFYIYLIRSLQGTQEGRNWMIILVIVGIVLAIALLLFIFRLLTGRDDPGGRNLDSALVYLLIIVLCGVGLGVVYGGDWLMYKVFNSGPVAEEKAHEAESKRQVNESDRKLKEQMAERLRAEEQVERIKKLIPDFASLPRRTQLANPPYLKGKLIVLAHTAEDKIAQLRTYSYLSDINAGSPEEVTTVVLLNCRKVRAGTFVVYSTLQTIYDLNNKRIPGFTQFCDLTIIDRTIPAVIYKKTFQGKPPGTDVSLSNSDKEVLGNEPVEEIKTFLSGLNRM